MSLGMYSVTPKRENVENQLQNCCKLSAEATLLKKMQFVSVVHAFFTTLFGPMISCIGVHSPLGISESPICIIKSKIPF